MSNVQCRSCLHDVPKKERAECEQCGHAIHKTCAINFGGAKLCDTCFVVKSEEPTSPFGEFELPETIRRTHIETYRACPYKFYLEVIKRNAQPPNEYTQVGSDVHEIIEQALRGDITYDEAININMGNFDSYDDELFQYRTKEDMMTRAKDSLNTFFKVIYPDIKDDKIIAIEEKIRFRIDDNLPDVTITMDLITEKDGELHMHDWKTGKVMVGQKLSTDLQAPLYIYAVREKYQRPVKSFTFYYLQENKLRTFVQSPYNPEEYICTVGKREYKINLTDAIREVNSVFSRIVKGDFNIPLNTRKMYFTCKMCHLREMGLCAGADEQAWELMQNN